MFLQSSCAFSRVDVQAVEYGSSLYPVDFLGTEDPGPYTRILWLFYVIKGPGSTVLVDTGMTNPADASQFAIRGFRPAAAALKTVGVDPADVTDIVLTHSHVDHAGSISLFPSARLFMQKSELTYFEKTERYERFRDAIAAYRDSGRLMVLDGDYKMNPWLKILAAGGHTAGSQAVQIDSQGRSVLITGDNCYFADACRKGIVLPEAAAQDPERNRAFVSFASKFSGKIVTLHDPAIVDEQDAGPGIYRVQY